MRKFIGTMKTKTFSHESHEWTRMRSNSPSFVCTREIRSRQVILLDLPIQRPLADAQDLGGLFAVAVDHFERVADEFLLGLGDADADEVSHAASNFAHDGAEFV